MSKTRGNIVTPDEVVADFGVHALRWYLLSANSFAQDGNYNDQDLILKCNADLSNNMGNLLNRSISMALKYFPEMQSDFRLKKSEPLSVTGVAQRMEQILGVEQSKLIEKARSFDLSGYCQLVLEFSVSLNKFIDETKPWALAKDPVQKPVLETVLYELLEGIRNLAILLWPVIPSASMAILEQLGRPVEIRKASLPQAREELEFPLWSSGGFSHQTRFVLSTPRPLFPRIERATEV
jgi:methionyl-tRNA synthetase